MARYAVGYVDAYIFSEEDLADKLIAIQGGYLLSVTEGILQELKDLKTKGDFIMSIFDRDKKFLTEKNGLGGFELKICMNCNPDAENKACGSCKFFQDAIDRLAAYEASGLTPKEVAKLKKMAEKGKVKEGETTLPVFDMADPDSGKKIEAWEEQNNDKD